MPLQILAGLALGVGATVLMWFGAEVTRLPMPAEVVAEWIVRVTPIEVIVKMTGTLGFGAKHLLLAGVLLGQVAVIAGGYLALALLFRLRNGARAQAERRAFLRGAFAAGAASMVGGLGLGWLARRPIEGRSILL